MPKTSLRKLSPWLTALALLVPAAAAAQGPANVRVSLLGGVGGSLDEDQAGLGNPSFQLGLFTELDRGVLLGLRAGAISYDASDRIGLLADPSVEYVNIGGEYRFGAVPYASGLFISLGAYRLEGLLAGLPEKQTELGLAIGVTGDFKINERFSILGELAGHVLDSEIAEFLVTAHVGVAANF